MNLDELKIQASNDLAIEDEDNLDQESYKNQRIKSKWLDYKSHFEGLLIVAKRNHQLLHREKWLYYNNKGTDKEYSEKPLGLTVLKTDLQMFITTDEEYCDSKSKIEYYEMVIRFIDGTIKSIDGRSWDIKHSIEWKKYLAGGF
tara:strand:+ start:153 stop:584 length:432 start_codon:yes stop_codon:yes gene_type:complete